MSKPIISWLDKDLKPLVKLQISSNANSYEAVVAGQESVETPFYIANNFTNGTAASTDLNDANECRIKITDKDGGINCPAVKEGWIKAKVEGDSSFTELGLDSDGKTPKTLKIKPLTNAVGKEGVLAGTKNDGNKDNTKANIAKIIMKAAPQVSTVAEAGPQELNTVLIYSYGNV